MHNPFECRSLTVVGGAKLSNRLHAIIKFPIHFMCVPHDRSDTLADKCLNYNLIDGDRVHFIGSKGTEI